MAVPDLQRIAPNLQLAPEGWWVSPTIGAVDYPEHGNEECFQIEESSFWFAHRNRCILEALRMFPPPGTFFDVGGGNGYVARAIQDSGQDVVLMEPGLAGVRNALRRGVRQVVRSTLEDAGVLPGTLPAIGLFDVVEHIPDHGVFLERVARLLIPGGRIYATVPAYDWLWSEEDVTAGHSRRYTLSALHRILRDTGFQVDFATYFFGFLPLPILLVRALPFRLGLRAKSGSPEAVRSDHQVASPRAQRMLEMWTNWEISRIAQRRTLPMGGSCLIVARTR